MHLSSFFSPQPQPLKSNKRGSSILFFFSLHKTPSRGMLVIHVYSSIMPCSSHYQPCCSYYASTSSALIKINVLRYHFMFPRFAYCLPKHRTQVHCTEPICCMVVVWEFLLFLFFFFSSIPPFFLLSVKAFPLTFLAAPLIFFL